MKACAAPAKRACTLDTSAVADEPEPDRIRLDFHKWTNFASNIEKFQRDTTGGRGSEPGGDTRGPVAGTHIAAARLHH